MIPLQRNTFGRVSFGYGTKQDQHEGLSPAAFFLIFTLAKLELLSLAALHAVITGYLQWTALWQNPVAPFSIE